MTSDNTEHTDTTPTPGGFYARISHGLEWLFLDFPYLLLSPGGLVHGLLRKLGRGLLALPRALARALWWLLGLAFGWQKPFWVWLARVTGVTALGRVYVQLEKPARIIFWVPVMLASGLLQNLIGGLVPVVLVAVLFIYLNKFVVREEDKVQLRELGKRHPN